MCVHMRAGVCLHEGRCVSTRGQVFVYARAGVCLHVGRCVYTSAGVCIRMQVCKRGQVSTQGQVCVYNEGRCVN
jgi:uncharacterized Fe-S cluster protein YjdI